jgi:hypothetical protein
MYMLPIFQLTVIGFLAIVLVFVLRRKNKSVVLLTGLIALLFGIFCEVRGVAINRWEYANAGFSILGVPLFLLIFYFAAGMLISIIVLSERIRKEVTTNQKVVFLILISVALVYATIYNDFTYAFLVLAVWLYTKINKDAYHLMLATIFAGVDILAEHFMIGLNNLTYTQGYSNGVYMAMFVSSFLLITLTVHLNNKLKVR